MKIAFFGSGAFGIPSLEAIRASRHELAAAVVLPDKPQGRKLGIRPSPVREWAQRNFIPLIEYRRENPKETISAIRAADADAFVVIAFGAILPKEVFGAAKLAVNVHASLLPRWRGAAPIQWAIAERDPETGVSVIRLSEKLDAGDVASQKRLTVGSDDYTALEGKLARLGAEALLETLDAFEAGTSLFSPQDESRVTLARKIAKEDGRLDWMLPAVVLEARVRAFRRWPVAYFFKGEQRVLVLSARAVAGSGRPGEILAASPKDGFVVAAGEGALRLLELQAEGRKALPAADFLNGFPARTGGFLE